MTDLERYFSQKISEIKGYIYIPVVWFLRHCFEFYEVNLNQSSVFTDSVTCISILSNFSLFFASFHFFYSGFACVLLASIFLIRKSSVSVSFLNLCCLPLPWSPASSRKWLCFIHLLLLSICSTVVNNSTLVFILKVGHITVNAWYRDWLSFLILCHTPVLT